MVPTTLRLFVDSDFALLKTWVTNAELLLQFSGTDFSFPLTKKQLADYQCRFSGRLFYLGLTEAETPFAFGEIIPQENGVPRLGRILIGEPSLRGKGLGRQFIILLLHECKSRFQTDRVELLTSDLNQAAIACYKSVGFVYNPVRHKLLVHEDRTFNIHQMVYKY